MPISDEMKDVLDEYGSQAWCEGLEHLGSKRDSPATDQIANAARLDLIAAIEKLEAERDELKAQLDCNEGLCPKFTKHHLSNMCGDYAVFMSEVEHALEEKNAPFRKVIGRVVDALAVLKEALQSEEDDAKITLGVKNDE